MSLRGWSSSELSNAKSTSAGSSEGVEVAPESRPAEVGGAAGAEAVVVPVTGFSSKGVSSANGNKSIRKDESRGKVGQGLTLEIRGTFRFARVGSDFVDALASICSNACLSLLCSQCCFAHVWLAFFR